jgi:hypothetical protein
MNDAGPVKGDADAGECLVARPAELKIEVGAEVRHKTYGIGRVEQAVEEFGIAKVVVSFSAVGLRKVTVACLDMATG